MKGTLVVYRDPEELADRFADQLMEWIAESSGKRFDLAISGGSTPNLLFAALASKYAGSKNWSQTHFWWVDERMVPADDPESNFGVAWKMLLSKINIPAQNIHRIKGECNPYQEASGYASQIREEVAMKDGWPRFDLILLGIGDDGHTASIFPNQMELIYNEHICEVATHPASHQQRVTLTGITLNSAARICFLVTGSNKSERLSEIWLGQEKGQCLPAYHIHPVGGELLWITDQQASQLITIL